jgi:uncharacterized repeat protein (TIGR01451 family)
VKPHFRRWLAGLGLWLAAAVIVCAQQPADLRLEKQAGAGQVVPGDRLRLTLTLNNEGTNELTGLVVSDVTPEGTAFFGAAGPRDWMITTPNQGGEGEVIWRSTAPLGPDESVELEMLITVRAESGTNLLSPGYTVQADAWDEPLTGPTVTVAVVAPTATPAPEPTEQTPSRLPIWSIVGGLAALIVVILALALVLGRRVSR